MIQIFNMRFTWEQLAFAVDIFVNVCWVTFVIGLAYVFVDNKIADRKDRNRNRLESDISKEHVISNGSGNFSYNTVESERDCGTCIYADEETGENCYLCVKKEENNYARQED